ncbi:LysR family transcriptional regulator [Tuberibacillus sp. Marseille-P3662]|uniref:LysR family transcriptional regulator n=1 Tax=Tuberibacillus sp. Marseille-P3662 TaxID=1965358 RepID=UPI000A1C7AB4|nr:LysR family transcriptional regulator [Tuberibacillus sp. Marseille-P3662]
MELRQIHYFMEVARREHVTEAAHVLHVAQSAISRHISLLEEELGVSLFIREGRNVKLTSVGRVFLKHMERVVSELDQAKQEIDDYLNPEKGLIRLGLATSLSIETLPMALSQFRDEHPDIQFQLHQGSAQYLKQLIDQGDINLAVISPVPHNVERLTGNIFYTEKLIALLPSDHTLAEQERLSLKQLRRERFVTFHKGIALHDIVVNACKQAGFTPDIAFAGEDIETIKGLVSADFGIALLPEHAFPHSRTPDLVTKQITEPEITRTVGIIKPNTRTMAPSEELFNQFLIDFYERLYKFGS